MKLIADGKFDYITDITPEKLNDKGIKLVLADLDNTLEPYNALEPREEIIRWHESLRAAGITLCIVSNNKKTSGVKYLEKLGAPYIVDAKKPKADSLLAAMDRFGGDRNSTVMVGDQTFTDVLAGHRAGVPVLMVRPVKLEDPLRTLRYWAEWIFRAPLRKKVFFREDRRKN